MSSAADTCRYAAIHYTPNKVVNIIVGAIYILLSLGFCFHQFRWRKTGVPGWKWAWVLPIGSLASALGFFVRTTVDPCNFKISSFIFQQLFIILSPCFFIAFNYAMFGRFITALEKPQLSWIKPHKVSKIFIWSDVITFWIQGGAGGLQAAQDSNMQLWGSRAFLLGVGLQLLSFIFFSTLVLTAHIRAAAGGGRELNDLSVRSAQHSRRLLWAFEATNVCYLIRCTFRTLEYALGTNSFLLKSEGYLIGLDAAPIIIALFIWLIIFPLQSIFEIGGERKESSPTMTGLLPVSSDAYKVNMRYPPPQQRSAA